LQGNPDFSAFGYEQQGAIVEEYLCCAVLAPKGARTQRLHDMLSASMPVAPISALAANEVRVPWKGVQLRGICD
jgi:hypothetical protein